LKFVFDTSAVIYLVEKWKLTEELSEFSKSHQLLIPQRVKEEFVNGEIQESDLLTLGRLFDPLPVKLEESLLPYFNFDSTDGAIWVISCGMELDECCCVIDEEFGRSICELLGVTYTGSIGIMREMISEKIIPRSRIPQLKTKIRDSAFYHSKALLEELDK